MKFEIYSLNDASNLLGVSELNVLVNTTEKSCLELSFLWNVMKNMSKNIPECCQYLMIIWTKSYIVLGHNNHLNHHHNNLKSTRCFFGLFFVLFFWLFVFFFFCCWLFVGFLVQFLGKFTIINNDSFANVYMIIIFDCTLKWRQYSGKYL